MKKSKLIFVFIFITYSIFSQSCLPNGISFNTQAEIDAFPSNYPGCTSIGGNVCIGDCSYPFSTSNISDLTPLSNLTSVLGDLSIRYNPNLNSLSGLDNIHNIGSCLYINNNGNLTNLTGLNGLNSVNISLNIGAEDLLVNLSGLENLSNVGWDFTISSNSSLNSLSGINNPSIGRDLTIYNNESLSDLTGLENLSTVGNDLNIQYNNSLTNLDGLSGLVSLGKILRIEGNETLNDLSGFDNLSSIQSLYILDNNNLIDLSTLPNINNVYDLSIHSNINLNSLNGILNISTINNLSIGDQSNLPNLDGIENFSTLEAISLFDNTLITDLSALSNLESLEVLYIHNMSSLQDLSGLDNLTSIGSLDIQSNNSLTNLNGLEGLAYIGSNNTYSTYVILDNNIQLSDISALSNAVFDPGIEFLAISNNTILSTCAINPICEALENNAPIIYFFNNSTGCNTQTEVEDACALVALPISWFSPLQAKQYDVSNVELLWSVKGNLDSKSLEIEHSLDGKHFEYIGETKRNNDDFEEEEYSYVHNRPSSGINYYRIRQVDYDGSFSFSNIASIYISDEKQILTIFPNPTDDKLSIISSDEQKISVYSIDGRYIEDIDLKAGENNLFVADYNPGIYFIKTERGEVRKVEVK